MVAAGKLPDKFLCFINRAIEQAIAYEGLGPWACTAQESPCYLAGQLGYDIFRPSAQQHYASLFI